MTHDPRRTETAPRDFEARSRATAGRAVTGSLIQDLEQLRELVLVRLSLIERLAQEHRASVMAERELSALEESFKKKSAELDESRHMLQLQAEREKQEWIAAMSQLEDDRRLLAEAWERIDQERIDAVSSHQETASVHLSRPLPQTGVSTGLPAVGAGVAIHSVGAQSDSHNPVAQAILQQFQTLCSDVRRNAPVRRASR